MFKSFYNDLYKYFVFLYKKTLYKGLYKFAILYQKIFFLYKSLYKALHKIFLFCNEIRTYSYIGNAYIRAYKLLPYSKAYYIEYIMNSSYSIGKAYIRAYLFLIFTLYLQLLTYLVI